MFRQSQEHSEFKCLLYFYYAVVLHQKEVFFYEKMEKYLKQFTASAAARKPEEWVACILKAREKAGTAQNELLDLLTDKQKTTQLYHALANDIARLFNETEEGKKHILALKSKFKIMEEQAAYLTLQDTLDKDGTDKINDAKALLDKLCKLGDKDSVRLAAQSISDLNYMPITCEEFFNAYLSKMFNHLSFDEFKQRLLPLPVPTSADAAVEILNSTFSPTKQALPSKTQSLLTDLQNLAGFGSPSKKNK